VLGWGIFIAAPVVLGGVLIWRFPRSRRVSLRAVFAYVVFMALVIWAALALVTYVASSRVRLREVILLLWFTIGCRLAWPLWRRTVGRLGQRWVRWARRRRRQNRPAPWSIRLIPPARAMLILTVFVPLLLATLLTHRCKLVDAQDPNSVFALPFEPINFTTSDGLLLDGWFVPQRDADRTIIICHGAGANKGNFVWFVGALAHHGYNLLSFDFRAHGSSEGRTTTFGILEKLDVRAAVDWVKQERPQQARTIVVLGSSLGAMAAALAAADDERIDAVVLDSPFVGPYELAMHHARRVPLLGPLFVDLVLAAISVETGTDFFSPSAERAVAQIGRRPVMVIHGDADFVMPPSHARRLYEAASGPRRLWFGPGSHSNIITTDPENYANHLFTFLNRYLGPPEKP